MIIIFFLFVLVILVLPIIRRHIDIEKYKKTTYYAQTQKDYDSVMGDIGTYGEYLIWDSLQDYGKSGAKFLFNVYLPNNGKTSEVDVVMIEKSGIYVFESKNYSGWIFGKAGDRQWTQTLPSRRSSHKEHFYNPLMQNNTHVNCIRKIVGNNIPIHAVTVFSNKCEFKDVTAETGIAPIIHRRDIVSTVEEIKERVSELSYLSDGMITDFYTKLFPYTVVTEMDKQKHIDQINNSTVCPRCGGKLILRTATQGKNRGHRFYGCENYPKCHFVRNIE